MKNGLYFNEIKQITQNKDNQEYEKKLNEIVNKLYKKVEKYDINKLLNNLEIFDYNDIDNTKNKTYNLIDIEELTSINFLNDSSKNLVKTYYFKNKNEYFIFYPNGKKIYQLENYRGTG